MTLSRCRIDPCLYTGRVFAEPVSTGQSLNDMAAFSCVFSVFIANETAFIFAMHGDFNRNAYNDIKRQLRKKGVKIMCWERHKKGRVSLTQVII